MWVKNTIRNMFLRKRTRTNLTSLLTYQLNVLIDNAADYIFFCSKLEQMTAEYSKRTHMVDIINDRLDRICSKELLDICIDVVNCRGRVTLDEAIKLLEMQEAISHASSQLKSMYETMHEINSKDLRITK